MNEPKVQQMLDETTDFLDRQRLLKQLWHLRRQREAEGVAADTKAERPAAGQVRQVAPQPTRSMVA